MESIARARATQEGGCTPWTELPMFQKISPTEAQSDAGFALRAGTKDYWIYSEGDRRIYVTRDAAHFGREGWGEYVHLSGLPDCWLPPHNIYAIPDRNRQQIARNISEALRFLGVVFKVE
jgi:hypothetical protein